MTNTAIANVTGLAERTIYNYLSDTDLGEAVKTVRQAVNKLDVEKKLAINKSALRGLERLLKVRKIKEVEKRIDVDGNVYMIVEKEKKLEPHAGIVQFALKNTDPQTWGEKQAPESSDMPEDMELMVIIDDDK